MDTLLADQRVQQEDLIVELPFFSLGLLAFPGFHQVCWEPVCPTAWLLPGRTSVLFRLTLTHLAARRLVPAFDPKSARPLAIPPF